MARGSSGGPVPLVGQVGAGCVQHPAPALSPNGLSTLILLHKLVKIPVFCTCPHGGRSLRKAYGMGFSQQATARASQPLGFPVALRPIQKWQQE
jgi:hypothetical protein